MTRHSYLLGGSACLADLLRLEDLRTLAKHMRGLPRPAERELGRRDSLCSPEAGVDVGGDRDGSRDMQPLSSGTATAARA